MNAAVDPRWRNGLTVAAAGMLAVAIGGLLAGGSLGIAAVVALGCAGIVVVWGRWARIETLLLGFLVAGYVIGNRGFAQIMPFPTLPLLFGELVLAIAGAMFLVQSALRRELPFRLDALNLVLLLLIVLGAARMAIDFRRYGLWALRDFATIYYIGFFFLAQHVSRAARERRLLGAAFVGSCLALPWVVLLFRRYPDFFLGQLVLNGTPIVFIKDDLAATFLLAGFFPLLAPPATPARGGAWRGAAAGTVFLAGLWLLSRAAMVGFALAAAFALAGRSRRILKVTAIAASLGIAAAAGAAALDDAPLRQSRLYALYEHLVSIADVQGRGAYEGPASIDSGDNNRFRLVWWRTIASRVLDENPVFGLGFGYDLSHDFVSTYELIGDDFNTRSPHNILFTALGRMGFTGLALFLGLFAAMAARTLAAARAARRRTEGSERALALWCACWVILVSACFGVVLEGPMGAVVFWTLLGLASASSAALETGSDDANQSDQRPKYSVVETAAAGAMGR